MPGLKPEPKDHAMKIYAILFSNGSQMICKEPWNKVEPLIHRVKGCVFKGFKDIQSAENWILIQRSKQMQNSNQKPLNRTSDISKHEIKSRTINTPYWKKQLGAMVGSRIELDQGFNRNVNAKN